MRFLFEEISPLWRDFVATPAEMTFCKNRRLLRVEGLNVPASRGGGDFDVSGFAVSDLAFYGCILRSVELEFCVPLFRPGGNK